MLKFKTFVGDDMEEIENDVNQYLEKNKVNAGTIQDFKVSHDMHMNEFCVSFLHQ